jgi:predicted Zn-dependent protease
MARLLDWVLTIYHMLLRLLWPGHPVSMAIRAEEALGRQQWGAAFDLSNGALKKRDSFAPAYYIRGIARLHLDDHQGALIDLNRFLAVTDEPPLMVYDWRGWIYLQRQEWSLALSDFERVLAEQPDDPHLYYWIAYIHWQREHWEKMRVALARLDDLTPDNPFVQELWGHLYLHEGTLDAADAAYTRAIDAGWDNPDLRYNRAVTRRQMGNLEGAAQDLEALRAMEPESHWACLEASNLAFARGDYQKALLEARAAIALERGFFEARISEAATLIAMDENREARSLLEEMREEFPDEPLVEQFHGDVLANGNEPSAAAESYRRALKKDPVNNAVRLKLAGELVVLGEYDRAMTEVERILAEEPDNQDALAVRIDLYRYNNQPERMRSDLDRLLAGQPDSAWALTFRAAHNQWMGNEQEAREDYDRALEADASQGWIWAFRGAFHLRHERASEARADLQQAITLDPRDPWIRRQWADFLHHTGQEPRAASVLDSLIAEHPDDGFARLFRADLHLQEGEWEAARAQWEAIAGSGHELAWLAHAALGVVSSGDARQRHLALADEQRPEPAFWGMTLATVRAQQALVAWLRGEHDRAQALLREAANARESGERLWLALRPLAERLGAEPLVTLLDAMEPSLATRSVRGD